jgi:hypothetical protein
VTEIKRQTDIEQKDRKTHKIDKKIVQKKDKEKMD